MFKLNDKVIYPWHGVALIKDICEKQISGAPVMVYTLSFVYKELSVFVPVHNAKKVGVRYLSEKKEIEVLFKKLPAQEMVSFSQLDLSPSGWNRRNKGYNERISQGTFNEIVSVYSDLMVIGAQKDHSFGEKKLLHVTEELIVQEAVEVLGSERSLVLQTLRKPFKKILPSTTHMKSDSSSNTKSSSL